MRASYVVVAESSRARVFEMVNQNVPLRELADMVHPGSRAHERELTSDLPGRSFDSHGQGHHAMESNVSPKEQEAIVFAGQVADYLNSECGKNKFQNLFLVAAPEFLGHLRRRLSNETRRYIAREINKNVVQQDEAVIRKYL